jgi:hypothetical protein
MEGERAEGRGGREGGRDAKNPDVWEMVDNLARMKSRRYPLNH